jgi:phage tail sheath gpL-like
VPPLSPDPGDTADQVATEIRAAIAGVSTLDITATIDPVDNTKVKLTNTHKSTHGTQAIVDDTGFTITGMSGGQAGDCNAGVGCASGDDCVSGVCLTTNHTCQ